MRGERALARQRLSWGRSEDGRAEGKGGQGLEVTRLRSVQGE